MARTAQNREAKTVVRCSWCGTDPLYVAYHDDEWGVPEYDSQALFEKLLLDGFQAGLSWITILRKREAFRAAFDGFDPEKMARYNARKTGERLMNDAGIVRNRAKIDASVSNARPISRSRRSRASRPICGASSTASRSRTVSRRSGEMPAATPLARDDLQGPQAARLPLLRAHHRLCLHAGVRHGQRPCGDAATAMAAVKRLATRGR